VILFLLLLMLLSGAVQAAPQPDEAKAYALFDAGKRQFSNGRWKEAADQLDKAVAINPTMKQAHFMLGVCRYQLYEFDAAEKSFLQVVGLDMRDYNGWVQLAQSAMAQGKFDKAKEYAQSILKFDQRSFLSYYAVGVVAYKAGKLKEAVDAFDRSRALYDEYAPNMYNLGVALYNSRTPQMALARLRKACLLEPKKPMYHFSQGWVAFQMKDMGYAYNSFRRVLDEDQMGPYAPTARGLMAMARQNFKDARKEVDEALKRDPAMVKALVLKALLQVQEGKKDDAVKTLQEALEIDPLDLDARDSMTRLGMNLPPPGPARLPKKPEETKPEPATPSPSPSPAASPTASPSPRPIAPPGAPVPR